MEYKLQITKQEFFPICVLSGTKQGEKDKIHAEFCLLHPVLYLTKHKSEKIPIL